LLALFSQTRALIVRESEPAATKLFFEDTVLLDQLLDCALLLAGHPADNGQ
jgi:hypothetical protein